MSGSRSAAARPAGATQGLESDGGVVTIEDRVEDRPSERQSTTDSVKSFGESFTDSQKRDRSESGDITPAGKRGARERGGDHFHGSSPGSKFKDQLDAAIDDFENRMTSMLSRDFHELRVTLKAEIDKLSGRVRDLEVHVEERDSLISELTEELRQSRKDVSSLQARVEDAEINSRLPCIILSGSAMAPRHAPRLEPPLPGRSVTAVAGQGHPLLPADPVVTSQPAETQTGGSAGAPGGSTGRH